MKLRYTAAALGQIDEALAYLTERSPQAAAALETRLIEAGALLTIHPQMYQATSRPGTRRLILSPYPYALFYKLVGEDIVVTRFRHTSRKPLRPSA